MLIEYIPTYYFFKHFVEINSTQKILDFGSNCGNFIKSCPFNINYTGLDIDLESVQEGIKNFPNASWKHYDRYHCVYNTNGKKNEIPDLKSNYDLIIGYSVFSHLDIDDFIQLIDYLHNLLDKNGTMCLSFCNIENNNCKDWFRKKRGNCDEIPNQDYIYLVDNKVSKVTPTTSCQHFVSFYSPEFLLNTFKSYNPRISMAKTPWFQDCILFSK